MNRIIDDTYKNFPTSMAPIFAKNFTTKWKDFGEVELFPIKGSVFDNYANTPRLKIGNNIKYPEINLINKESLGNGISGNYNYITNVANISKNEVDPLSTAVHEAISHNTDDVYRYLAHQGSELHKHSGSSDWSEVRDTLNELRFGLLRNKMSIDDLSDREILDLLYNINGYGADYYRALSNKPEQNKNWFDAFRLAYNYLPATTPLTLPLNKKQR